MSIIARRSQESHVLSSEYVLPGRITQAVRDRAATDGLPVVLLSVLVYGTVQGLSAGQVMLLTAEVSLFVVAERWWRARRA
ncbi:hypothetical protein ACIQI7_09085 [Kitasatospora sp. NPDC092039]|uniref:hypothetical protein n=1 Tax=Kitasatospora sp. NPDC092039 TaxID=3364086 RepID=UPI00380CC458